MRQTTNVMPEIQSYCKGTTNARLMIDLYGNTFYFSYKTLVAFQKKNHPIVCIKNYWSTTTGKHLNQIEPNKLNRLDIEDFESKFSELFGNTQFPSI